MAGKLNFMILQFQLSLRVFDGTKQMMPKHIFKKYIKILKTFLGKMQPFGIFQWIFKTKIFKPQEKLLEQRLWLLRSYLMPGAHSNVSASEAQGINGVHT